MAKGAVEIYKGISDELRLGNLKATRDWGHAKDYVQAMWMILQQDKPDDYVCATGISHSVGDLVEHVFNRLGLDWKKYVKKDPRYYRPEELHDFKGDCTKLKTLTGWKPKYTFEAMMDEMVDYWIDEL